MIFSQLLKDYVIAELCGDGHDTLGEAVTANSTAGYDNDGSIGPDLVAIGVWLGECLARTHTKYGKGDIFFANDADNSTRYYQIGTDEADALARLKKKHEADQASAKAWQAKQSKADDPSDPNGDGHGVY